MFDFLNGIGNLFGGVASVISAIEQVLAYLWNLIKVIATVLARAIVAIGNFFWGILTKVGSFFQHIWGGLKSFFGRFVNAIHRFYDWLAPKIQRLLTMLKKWRDWLDRFYRRYITPVLKVIHTVRRVLLVLRALHVKFAEELDRKLGQVEGKITQTFLLIRGTLNQIIDVVNILADPTALLRKPMLIISLRRSIHALIRTLTGLPPGYFFPSPHKGAPRGLGYLPDNFNPADPVHNPPASYYLGLDEGLPSFDFMTTGEPPADGDIDDLPALEYFLAISEEFDSPCTDSLSCMLEAERLIRLGIHDAH